MFGTNKQLINHLYNDVKNLTSILSCCIDPKRVSSNNGTELYLCVIITFHYFVSQHYNHLQPNNQPIDLLCNDVKNSTSIFELCIGPKCVSSNDDTKALFLCELHFSLFVTIRPLNHQRKNKQPINLRYNHVKNLTSILSYCIGPKRLSTNDDIKALFLCELHFSLIFTSRPLNHQQTNKQIINFSITR